MARIRWMVLALFLVLLAGCDGQPLAIPSTQPSGPAAATLAGAAAPDAAQAQASAIAYLESWKAERYPDMYALLTSVSRDALSEEEFTRHYQGVFNEAVLDEVEYEILSVLVGEDSAQVSYRITLHSRLVGDISRETVMNLSLERDQWRVQWDDTLVLPDLKGGNYLWLDRSGYIPSRANIYDRYGQALVAQASATAIGLYPDRIDPAQEPALFQALTDLTGMDEATIRQLYANFPKGGDWYLPLGEVSADQIAARFNELTSLKGLGLNSYKSRYYFDGGVAPHVVGYIGPVPAEEVEAYQRLGYRVDDRVGLEGLEKWGEPYLAGKRGGALYVLNAQGQPVTRLAEAPAEPGQAVYATLERDFQLAAQQSIAGFRGAVVALEIDTGRVVAMVSSPGFDPNAFEPVNYNSGSMLSEIASDPAQPLYNRATLGQYPLGSVFKIITMAAAIESGLYTPESTYQCGYTFVELPGALLYDWTYEHYQIDRKTIPSGLLTLSGGLIRSCNPFFYHIGLDLFNRGMTSTVSDMARGFGLGSPTGIEHMAEEDGQVLDPENMIDATNGAIGQGPLLVTPLQVAQFTAAVGNGGTLYQPQVIEKVASPDGSPEMEFKPQVRGKLPVKPDTLRAIQEAMVNVVVGTEPRGTAYHVFTGLDIPVAGKTGTAQTSEGQMPHAWFAGYTFANQPDRADIAVVVMMENIGEGSNYAAPVFRRLVELYFRGSPGKLYPWESTYYVNQTPTPGADGADSTPQP